MTQNSEHRLIHRTLASLDEQRKAAGLAPLATPVGTSPRSAQANAQVQQQQYSQNLATAQAGSAQIKAATDANFAAKKTISDLSSLYENGTFTGTADQMAELNDAQGKLNYTNQTLDAQSRIAANAADTSGKKTLDALALGGQQQTYDTKTGITQLSGEGNLEQSAITRLRESGLNDQQIAEKMKDPEYMNAIRTTMSNTGLNSGTARQSAVLTPAQAQNILATSRSPKERAAAQKVIDDQVNQVKGYDQVPMYNKDGQLVGYSNVENSAKTQENQQKEKDRLALEESNRLKAQENKDALKKFTAGVDPAPVEQTKTQIDELMASIKNLSPDLQAAVLPSLISLQQSNNDITKEVNSIISSQPTDEEIQANYGSLEKYIQSEDAKYKALIERNMETAKEVATYNRDMLEAEKAIIEHDAAVAEQKQVIANAEGEKQLRRQLNRLGIQTDVQGLTYLQNEVQKGVDALENLKTANNLVSLKAQLAIGEGYRLEVKQAMETYEGNYLNITSQTTERLNAIKQSISTAKADRNKEIKEARKWGLEKKIENDKATSALIQTANFRMLDDLSKQKTQDAQKEKDALAQIEYLSKNFEPSVVADQIKELAKSVTSFDASSLAGQAPIALQLALKKLGKGSGSGGGGGFNFSSNGTAQVTATAPLVTLSQFYDQKISERENELGLSMNPTARKEYLDSNQANLMAEYNAMKAVPSTTVVSSGNQSVDEAARLIYEGVIPSISEAAKKLGVPYGAVAQQVSALRKSGVGDNYIPMTDKQQASFLKLSKSLDTDPVVQYARSVPNKVSNILTALDNRNGVSDLAAINSFQNGLVDPGVSVRSDDINLIVNQAMPILSKYSTAYWKNKFSEGAIIPDAEREQIRQLANQLQQNIVNVYQNTSYQRTLQTGRALGIPEQNLQVFKTVDYSNPNIPTVQPEPSDTTQSDSEYDSLLSSYGY